MSSGSKIEQRKQSTEAQDFLCFSYAAGLSVKEDTLVQPPPRAPDIQVHVNGIGVMAFEMGDVNSPERHKGLSIFTQAPGLMDGHHQSLSTERHTRFEEKYRGAHIMISISHTPSQQPPEVSFKKAIPKLFELLEALPGGYTGDVFEYRRNHSQQAIAEYLRNLALRNGVDMLTSLHVSRAPNDQPLKFIGSGGGSVMPLDISVLKKKLTSAYDITVPTDLVLTVRMGESAHLGEIGMFQAVATAGLENSAFERVWFHETLLGKVTLLAGPPLKPSAA
ncbi:hypothetical protein [Rhodanobacter terrae]|uniref:Uncharacterized protein n=1 Tax=Rhodanobacter terrae TaxID=418647 RepID=A0ABW0SSQ1_9GAMM